MKELFEQILHYGTFRSDFECTNDLGMAIRIRIAELDRKKYIIVQCNGNVLNCQKLEDRT